ncbi:unnamed protein product [Staurois parvus]|uniref:Uncharacterized protein n=1 Tax=Staurois parvus TaxID=386267 RepID=A0ABN9EEQ4_9NEOB|nr:unnamed protein product [Staurois parvus]
MQGPGFSNTLNPKTRYSGSRYIVNAGSGETRYSGSRVRGDQI